MIVCVCVCVFHLTKIDQAEGPETFFNFAWPYTEVCHLVKIHCHGYIKTTEFLNQLCVWFLEINFNARVYECVCMCVCVCVCVRP